MRRNPSPDTPIGNGPPNPDPTSLDTVRHETAGVETPDDIIRTDPADWPIPTRGMLKVVAAFEPLLDSIATPEWPASTRAGGMVQMPVLDDGPVIGAFHELVYAAHLVVNKDWVEWRDEVSVYVDNPNRLRGADLRTLQRLTTVIFRSERFCEGTIAAMHRGRVLSAICRCAGELAEHLPLVNPQATT